MAGVGVHAPVVEPAGTTPPHPELRAEQHLVAASADRPTDQLLVAVHLGGVEQGDTGVDGGVHNSYRVAVGVCRGAGLGVTKPHQAEALTGRVIGRPEQFRGHDWRC